MSVELAAIYLPKELVKEARLDASAIRRRIPSVRELLEAAGRAIRALIVRMAGMARF